MMRNRIVSGGYVETERKWLVYIIGCSKLAPKEYK